MLKNSSYNLSKLINRNDFFLEEDIRYEINNIETMEEKSYLERIT